MLHLYSSPTMVLGTLPQHFMLALLCMLSTTAVGDSPAQNQQITAALRQLAALERLVEHNQAGTLPEPGQRYYLDHVRLLYDLKLVRVGLQDYLAPSRAQPRDPVELTGHYRSESPIDTERTEAPSP